MQEEIESLHKNRTWDLCELPKGCHVLAANGSTNGKMEFLGLKMQDGNLV